MTQKIKLITIIDLLFLLLLGASGSIENEAVSNVVYYLAFLIPIALGVSYISGNTVQTDGALTKKIKLDDFKIKKEGALLSLPLIIPEIFTVLLISVATTAIMDLLGQEDTASFTDPFIYAVLIHALIPAALEELLFRFIPIKLLEGEEKTAIILSSLMFAFAHASLFQIPYAFVAGIIFASVYIATGSIIPTVIMHFINNLFSLITIYEMGGGWLWPTFTALLVISVVVIAVRRKAYKEAFKALTSGGKIKIGYPPILFMLLSFVLATSVLFV